MFNDGLLCNYSKNVFRVPTFFEFYVDHSVLHGWLCPPLLVHPWKFFPLLYPREFSIPFLGNIPLKKNQIFPPTFTGFFHAEKSNDYGEEFLLNVLTIYTQTITQKHNKIMLLLCILQHLPHIEIICTK